MAKKITKAPHAKRSVGKKVLKASSSILGSLGTVSVAFALPSGGVVVSGNVNIAPPNAGTLTITQDSAKGIINWGSPGVGGFSISAGETVQFIHQAAGHVTLNRDLSGALSLIQGTLTANGNVFLINPAGVVFGANSSVNVGGLLATTLNVTDDAFNGAGPMTFTQSGAAGAVNVLQGADIKAGGFVYLVAPQVSNDGSLTGTSVASPIGEVVLAGTDQFQVQYNGAGLIGFELQTANSANTKAEVANTKNGRIQSSQVLMTASESQNITTSVVNNAGIVEATDIDFAAAVVQQQGTLANRDSKDQVTASNSISLKARDSLSFDSKSITRTKDLSLEVTKERSNIGSSSSNVRVQAERLDAKTNKGNIFVTDTSGDLMVGRIDTGRIDRTGLDLPQSTVFINASAGKLIQGNKLGDGIRAGGVTLRARNDIGSESNLIKTEAAVLQAEVSIDGGVYIENTGSVALGSVLAKNQAEEQENAPIVGIGAIQNGQGAVRLADGRLGTKDVVISVKAQPMGGMDDSDSSNGDIVLTGSVAATRDLSISADGMILNVTPDPANPSPQFPGLTGRTITLNADQDIGLNGAAVQTRAEEITANSKMGGVYLNQSAGISGLKIDAAKNVSVSTDNGSIIIDSIKTRREENDDTEVRIVAKGGNILGLNSIVSSVLRLANELPVGVSPGQITASNVYLDAKNAIGLDKAIELNTDNLSVVTRTNNNSTLLKNDVVLKSLDVDVINSKVDIEMGAGKFLFDPVAMGKLEVLAANLMNSLTLITRSATSSSDSNISIAGLALDSKATVSLNAAGTISQQGASPLTAKDVTFIATKGIGDASGQHLQLKDVAKITASTNSGDVAIKNDAAGDLMLRATTTSGSVSIEHRHGMTPTGTVSIDLLSAGKSASLKTTGDIRAEAGAVSVIAGQGMTLEGKSLNDNKMGPLVTRASGDINLKASDGAISIRNTGIATDFNADATGDITLVNSGDVAFGAVTSTMGNIGLTLTGKATDKNGNTVNFSGKELTFSGASFGASDDALEVHVDRITIDTRSGGIFLEQPANKTLSVVRTTALGGGVEISNGGDIGLGVVEAQGNDVEIRSIEGKIFDDRVDGEQRPNVRARALVLDAKEGIEGKNGNNLALSVSFLSAAGGDGNVAAENASPVALDGKTLAASGGAVKIIAPDITILDGKGQIITLNNASLELTATRGNIVFLNQKDTIYVQNNNPSQGFIKFTALGESPQVSPGMEGVIIVGNLKTDGGDITLTAASNITIGMLDTLSSGGQLGDVTVASKSGIILDGNGLEQNIRGDLVTLSASTPTKDVSDFRRSVASGELSAREVRFAERTNTLDDTKSLLAALKAIVASNESDIIDLESEIASLERSIEALENTLAPIETSLEVAEIALTAAGVVRNALGFASAAGQAIPFSGDGGLDIAFAAADLAFSIADAAVLAIEKSIAPLQERLEDLGEDLQSTEGRLDTREALRDSFETLVDDRQAAVDIQTDLLFQATFLRDQMKQVLAQAVRAHELSIDIESSSVKPLGVTANRLDINAGGEVNTSVFLDSNDSMRGIGLGDIKLKAGEDLVVRTAGDISQVGKVEVSASSDGKNLGVISLQADKSINGAMFDAKLGQPIFIANNLITIAGTGVGSADKALNTSIDNLAVAAGAGGVNIDNRKSSQVDDKTQFADLNITELTPIGMTSMVGASVITPVTGISAAGDIRVTTEGNLNLKELVEDTVLGSNNTITLTSAQGSLVDQNGDDVNTRANALVASAKNDINLDTDINELTASTSGMGVGDITIDEVSSLTIKNADAGNGSVSVEADGNITIETIKARDMQKDSKRVVGNVSLSAKGTTKDSVGFIRDDGNQTTFIDATQLTLNAKADVGGSNIANDEAARSLDTKVDSVIVDAGDVVNLADEDDLDVIRVTTKGDVTLQSFNGSLKVGEITTDETNTTVTLFAEKGSVTDNRLEAADATVQLTNITADRLAIKALSGVGSSADDLNVKVAVLEAETSTGGITITDQSGDLAIDDVTPGLNLLALDGVRATSTAMGTTGGDITIKVEDGSLIQQREVSTTAGNINLTAKNSVTVGSVLKSLLGMIGVTAQTGSITTESDAPIIATADVTLTADTSIEQNADISSTDEGDVTLLAKTGDIDQRANIAAKTGDVSVTATVGSITMATNKSTIISTKGDIAYVAGKDINSEILTTELGDIELEAGKAILAGNAITTKSGSVDLLAKDGSITTESDAPIIATADVTLTADTSIEQNADISSTDEGDVTLLAKTGDIDQRANIAAKTGDVSVTATVGSITMRDATTVLSEDETRTEVASGNITLSAGKDINVAALVASNDNTVTLTATDGTIFGQENTKLHVQAGTLDATAKSGIGIALRTSLSKLIAKVTGIGNINIDEVDELELVSVSTDEGDLKLKAGGDVVVRDVAITGDADLDINGKLSTSKATPDDAAGKISANNLLVVAQTGVDIKTQVTEADIELLANGNITIDEVDSITLKQLRTVDGDVTVDAGDTISVIQVVAGGAGSTVDLSSAKDIVQNTAAMAPAILAEHTLLSAATGIGASGSPLSIETKTLGAVTQSGNIVLTQAGNLAIGEVTTTGQVDLDIVGGGLVGVDENHRLAGDKVTVTAEDDVTVNTEATAELNIKTLGDIDVTEKDGIARVNLDGSNVVLSSTEGDIGVGLITAVTAVSVDAKAGAIVDADNDDTNNPTIDIVADTLSLKAAKGIGQPEKFLELKVSELSANANSGGIYLSNEGDLKLLPVFAGGGNVIIRTDANLEIAGNASNTGGGNITLQATGDVDQAGDVSATGRGSVSVVSTAGNIDMDREALTSVVSGVVDYQAAQTLEIGKLEAKGNGTVQLTAPMITSNVPEGGNVKAFFLNVNSENVDRPFFELLLGENAVEAALLRLNMRVVGGNLANSRQFMDHLLQPLGLSTSGNGSSGQALINQANPLKSLEMNVSGQLVQSSHNTWVFQIKQ